LRNWSIDVLDIQKSSEKGTGVAILWFEIGNQAYALLALAHIRKSIVWDFLFLRTPLRWIWKKIRGRKHK
jgi:hypothetical protein